MDGLHNLVVAGKVLYLVITLLLPPPRPISSANLNVHGPVEKLSRVHRIVLHGSFHPPTNTLSATGNRPL